MRKSGWIVVVALLTVLTGYFVYRSYMRAEREYHIFCETLVPGMTQEDVFSSLKEFGEISYSTPPSFGNIAVGYVDPDVVGQKTYILTFRNKKYTGASIIVWLEDVESVCE
jgi:hypothetical protein